MAKFYGPAATPINDTTLITTLPLATLIAANVALLKYVHVIDASTATII
jgi:hypothetical protein